MYILVILSDHGGWSDWSNWGSCSRSCGGGTKLRRRACTNPVPRNAGKTCEEVGGSALATASCETQPCPGMQKWDTLTFKNFVVVVNR